MTSTLLVCLVGCRGSSSTRGSPATSTSGSGAASSAAAPAQSGGPAPAATSAASTPAVAGQSTKIDLDKIFPAGKGRDLVLNNCQNCHTFVPIVVLQMDKDAWQRNSLDHRPRVTNLSDDEFKTLYAYLTTSFGPDHAVPRLPQELLDTWTSY